MKTITLEVNDEDARAIHDVVTLACERDRSLVVTSVVIGGVLAEICRDWMNSMFIVPPSEVSTCIGCGCTDNAACDGGCEWIAVNRETKRGVCSNCETHLASFEAEQRVQEFRETLANQKELFTEGANT